MLAIFTFMCYAEELETSLKGKEGKIVNGEGE